jgi:CheY-like chemotaxis protein
MAISILLIDDDDDDCELFGEALQEISPESEFSCISDGCEVIRFLEASHELPQLIFLDINMPRMDGWECLNLLKGHPAFQQIPVFMYSTSSLREDRAKALSLGALELINKPNDYNVLKQVILQAIDRI